MAVPSADSDAAQAGPNGLSASSSQQQFELVAWCFLRLLALIYLAAFASLLPQIEGLVGSRGISPVGDLLREVRLDSPGLARLWRLPTWFWLDASDAALRSVCFAGVAAALVAFFDRATPLALTVCYLLYLSLTLVGQEFLAFQWDVFLLEAGFIAIFLGRGQPIVIWLLRWLLFRFMLMGGVVKIASGDPTWRALTALRFHFETQPLPAPPAWFAHHLPHWALDSATAATLTIELIMPFFVFCGWPWRSVALLGFAILQVSIILTGNYGFFNLLTLVLCMTLSEDRQIARFLPTGLCDWVRGRCANRRDSSNIVAGLLAAFNLSGCAALWALSSVPGELPKPLVESVRAASRFGLINGYGPFAVMTTERRELIVEGSLDGVGWEAYGFVHKPDRLDKPLRFNIPHQPRLDWQMWFAALRDPRASAWLARFLERLREGSPQVLALLGHNPFAASPPRFLRVQVFRYVFAPPDKRAAMGAVWTRELLYTVSFD